MDLKKWMVVCGIFLLPHCINAQIWDGEDNRLGLKAGANYFNIITQDLPFTPKASWTAGFTTRSSFRENFQWIYGINFYDFRSTISGREKLERTSQKEEIPYNMIGVQASFLGSYKIIADYLSIEAGPVLQVNGKMEPRQNMELFYIEGYDIQANSLENVSTFNFNIAFGLSGGFKKFKFWAQYQFGINNILSGLNNENLGELDPNAVNFEGNMSMLSAGIVLFL